MSSIDLKATMENPFAMADISKNLSKSDMPMRMFFVHTP